MILRTFCLKTRTHSMRGSMPRPPHMAGDWFQRGRPGEREQAMSIPAVHEYSALELLRRLKLRLSSKRGIA